MASEGACAPIIPGARDGFHRAQTSVSVHTCAEQDRQAIADDTATPHRRRSLACVLEAALYFFGVANEEQFEGLLDDAEQRTMLRDWLRSTHCPRDAAASVADHDTQTTAVSNMVTAAPTTREVGSMATYSSSRVRLLNAQSQTPVVRVAQRASQANVAVPVADAAVGAAASMADAQTQSVVETARCEHEPLPGSWSWLDSSCNSDGTCCGCA